MENRAKLWLGQGRQQRPRQGSEGEGKTSKVMAKQGQGKKVKGKARKRRAFHNIDWKSQAVEFKAR